jgi:hypothetical protein
LRAIISLFGRHLEEARSFIEILCEPAPPIAIENTELSLSCRQVGRLRV